ncbi:MAG: apiosidase-like domain-containing protein, partial [Limisphaerales bacterium]
YEALEINPTIGAREAREAFWAHLLNSGCAGHTYGANGVWQVNRADLRFGKSPGGNDWGGTPWDVSMRLPGSSQLARAKEFLLTLPWTQLAPATRLVAGAVSASATADGGCALAYLIGDAPVTVDLTKLKRPVRARWFDPTSGGLKPVEGAIPENESSRQFTPPGRNASGDTDWVLVFGAP